MGAYENPTQAIDRESGMIIANAISRIGQQTANYLQTYADARNKELEKAIAKKFVTPQKFAIDIEKIVVDEDLNYIDAIIHYCEIHNIEVESVTKLISKPLKERLKWDAIRLNFMKKTSRAKLPL